MVGRNPLLLTLYDRNAFFCLDLLVVSINKKTLVGGRSI
jgi:hypothetical protein